jgi:hypothetical protein
VSAVSSSQSTAVQWMRDITAARAVYGVLVDIVGGAAPNPRQMEVASRVPASVWARVLALESCGAWLNTVSRHTPATDAMLRPAAEPLRATSADAVRSAMKTVHQLTEIADLISEMSCRVLALKGAARLLVGEAAGARTLSDIDLLVEGRDVDALHAALQARLGYVADEPGTPARHLPSLRRANGLPVEIHRRLSDRGSALDARVWAGARRIPLGRGAIEVSDPTAMILHALDHAVVVHRTARFRLRDVIDVAILGSDAVAWDEIDRYVRAQPDRRAFEVLLDAACTVPSSRPPARRLASAANGRRAWRTIRRVGRARLLAPARTDIPPGTDPRIIVLSQLAQASPGGIVRLALRAMSMPRRAARLVGGSWLPVEAERARQDPVSAADEGGANARD